MRNILTVYEDFLPNYWEYRNWALQLNYATQTYHGETFTNVSADWGRFPNHLLSDVLGFTVCPVLSFLRSNQAGSSVGSTPPIHCDVDVDSCDFASVLYMTTPEIDSNNYSGTAFWRHRQSGLISLPDDVNALKYSGYPENIIQTLNQDGFDETKWELEGMVRMKANRMMVYPAKVFHSRYPFDGIGDSVANSRLIWVNFFNMRENG